MENKQWYKSLFEGYGQTYDSESFTQGTAGECDFIERELDFNNLLKYWMSVAEQADIPLN